MLTLSSNPHNPTGAITPTSTLREIAKIAAERDIIVFSDEIYRPVFHSIPPTAPEIPPAFLSFGYKNTAATSSLSKSYSLTGIRLGWIASHNPSIIALCVNARSYCLITASQVDEHIADFALEAARVQTIVERNTALAERNAEAVQSFVDSHSSICRWVRPVGGPIGFIQFTRLGKPVDDSALCTRLLDEKGVLLVPGNKCFGGGKDFPGYVRLGFGVETTALQAGLDALSEFIEEGYETLPLAEETE